MGLPTVVTLAYFVWAKNLPSWAQQTVYSGAKIVQFGFPIFWVCWIQKRRPRPFPVSMRGARIGFVFGMVVVIAALILYFGWLRSADFFTLGAALMRQKMVDLGLDQAWKFAAVGVFYSVCHSLMEEYYWRWFVFGQLRRLTPLWLAVVVSSLGFMAHHVLVVGTYFGFFSAATWLFSLAIAIGGAFWAWLYDRTATLVGPWIGHLLIDAVIFWVGYDIARVLFAG